MIYLNKIFLFKLYIYYPCGCLHLIKKRKISLSNSRVIKSVAEIEVLRYVAKVSSDAHKAVMKAMK